MSPAAKAGAAAKTGAAAEATGAPSSAFSAEERAAMKEHAAEVKKARGRQSAADKAAGDLADTVAKIESFEEPDRSIARRLHALVAETAPELAPKLWYGMPSYARDGKVVLFFKDRKKFGSRYATLGFEETAALDDGAMWVTSVALTEPGEDDWARIGKLVRKAAG